MLKQLYDSNKTYLLNNSVIEQAIKSYDEGLERIKEFTNKNPAHKSLAESLKSLFDKNDKLHQTLLIESCEFNEKFIRTEIEKSGLLFNRAEAAVFESLARFPGKITATLFINQKNQDSELRIIIVDDILEKSQKNLDAISKKWLSLIYEKVQGTKDSMEEAKRGISEEYDDYLYEPLDEWIAHTGEIKRCFLDYLELRKRNTAEFQPAKNCLNLLQQLLDDEISAPLAQRLQLFKHALLDDYLPFIDYNIAQCQMWLSNLIVFQPTHIFSDVHSLQNALEIQISALNRFKNANNHIVLNKFIELLTLFRNLLVNVNIRALNLSLDSIPRLRSLLQISGTQYPNCNEVCHDLSNLLNEYKTIYMSTISNLISDRSIRDLIKCYWVQKLRKVKNSNSAPLTNLVQKAIETFTKELAKTVPEQSVKQLAADYRHAVPISDNVRDLVYATQLYFDIQSECREPNCERLRKVKFAFDQYITEAKRKADNAWKTRMEKHLADVKASVNNSFKTLINLPKEVNELLKATPKNNRR